MFETAVRDGLEKLGLEQKVAEGRAVHADVGALRLSGACRRRIAFLRIAVGTSSGDGISGLKLFVGVIDQVFFGRHVDGVKRGGRVRVSREAEGSR